MARLVIGTSKAKTVPVITKEIEKLPALGLMYENSNGMLIHSTTESQVIDFTNINIISSYTLYQAYKYNRAISGVLDMSTITLIQIQGCYHTFDNCDYITSVDLSSLTNVLSNGCQGMFSGCDGITSADLRSIETISGSSAFSYMFESCRNLSSFNLGKLKTISGSSACERMFVGVGLTTADLSFLTSITNTRSCDSMFFATPLQSVDLSSLTVITGNSACQGMFKSCSSLTSLYLPSITPNSFGSYTNQFSSMFANDTNITLHLPSNTQAKVETLSGYSTTAPFGAVSGTVLFDLPATNTLTGADTNTYSRNPKYDTATALAWKVGAYGTTDFTPFYTSGTSDPTVGTTIYSDASCTTAVTTISSIA